MEQQRTELISLARQNADPAASYAPLQDQIDALADRLDALTTRVSALEQSGGDEPEQPAEEWPEYVQPTGAHDAYHNGDKAHGTASIIPVSPQKVRPAYGIRTPIRPTGSL